MSSTCLTTGWPCIFIPCTTCYAQGGIGGLLTIFLFVCVILWTCILFGKASSNLVSTFVVSFSDSKHLISGRFFGINFLLVNLICSCNLIVANCISSLAYFHSITYYLMKSFSSAWSNSNSNLGKYHILQRRGR